CLPGFVKSVRARAGAATGLPKKRRGSRRSRCTRISADVRVSAALIASLIASKSGSPRNRRVHLGRFAMALPAPACATATRLAPTTRETAAAPVPAAPAAPKDRTRRVPPAAAPGGAAATLTRGLEGDPADRERGEPGAKERVEIGGLFALALPTPSALDPTPRLTRRRPARRDSRVDCVRRGLEPGGVAPVSEARRDDPPADLAGRCVGPARPPPAPHLHPHLPPLAQHPAADPPP